MYLKLENYTVTHWNKTKLNTTIKKIRLATVIMSQ